MTSKPALIQIYDGEDAGSLLPFWLLIASAVTP